MQRNTYVPQHLAIVSPMQALRGLRPTPDYVGRHRAPEVVPAPAPVTLAASTDTIEQELVSA